MLFRILPLFFILQALRSF